MKCAVSAELAKHLAILIRMVPCLGMEHYTWDDMETEKMSECIGRKIISGEKAMVAQVFLAKGAVVAALHAPIK